MLNGNVDKKAILLAEQLAKHNELSECENLLKSFSEETNAVFWLEDEYGSYAIIPPSDDVEFSYGVDVVTENGKPIHLGH